MTKAAKGKPRLNLRSFTSFLVTLTFLVIAFTGVIMYFTPQGRMAHWTHWQMLGLDKEQWSALHINNCLLFLIGSGLHIYLNWRVLWSYISTKRTTGFRRKWEFVLATVLTIVFIVGTLAVVPPFSTIMAANENMKTYWSRQVTTKAPVPHAESLPLRKLTTYIEGTTVPQMIEVLREAGYEVTDGSTTLEELAAERGVSPMAIFETILNGLGIERREGGGQGPRGRAPA